MLANPALFDAIQNLPRITIKKHNNYAKTKSLGLASSEIPRVIPLSPTNAAE